MEDLVTVRPTLNYVRLAELAIDGQIPYGIVQPGTHVDDGVPIVRVGDIRNGTINTANPLRVDRRIAATYSRTILRGGELLISLVGTVGECAVVPEELVGWNVARAVAVVRPEGISSHWMRFCLALPEVRHRLQSVLNTTVQATLNLSDLKALEIPVGDAATMKALVRVMGALDDKIAANAKLARTADELAGAIFLSMLGETESLPLTDVAQFVNGRAFTKGACGTGRVVIRIAELNSGIGGSTVYSDIEPEEKYFARPGDLLFAWSGSLTLRRWFRPEGIVNQHIFKVMPFDAYPLWLVHGLLARKLDAFKAIAADKATTMGHIQRRHLDEAVDVPVRSAVEGYDPIMSALWQRALGAEQENLTLGATRDALLPHLMSGRLRVRDAEKAVEEVL
ncbi:MAG: hypothetical protein GEV10_01020 [Streptosporangiales bacterium]|nr:hypothetical protein [Streptosporangiales bacterium]